jgi:UDP-glucose 4-epimerase
MSINGKHILVTGGNGYIGSHTVIELLNSGANITIIDNFCNSNPKCLDRIREISGKDFTFVNIDLCNYDSLHTFFVNSPYIFDACIHFAGLKAVGESINLPLNYYYNNLISTIFLLKCLDKFNCRNFIFSSSATVYGSPKSNPISESTTLSTVNPYGTSKLMIENILRDLALSSTSWNIIILRYFNPIGAHPSGKIGEDPNGIPNNLLPYVLQVAIGKLPFINIFGNDYDTPDGTGVRDFIHVVDLARGHLAALENGIFGTMKSNCECFNLGCGKGNSVLELIKTVESICGHTIPYKIVSRRYGDIATCYSDPSKANEFLKWNTNYSLYDSIKHSWNWQSSNPLGFNSIQTL